MTPQQLTRLCLDAADGSTIHLAPQQFDVYSDDCLVVEGYHFSNTASMAENPRGLRPVLLYMKNKKDIVIDGGGSCVRVHGIMTPFLFDGCSNITLRGFTFDYAIPTMSEFTIQQALGDGRYRIRVAPDTLYDIVDGRHLLWHGEKGRDGRYLWQYGYREQMVLCMRMDPATEFVQMMGSEDGMRFPCVPEFAACRQLEDHLLEVQLARPEAFFPVGCTVQCRNTPREQIGGAFIGCSNVLCEALNIHAMHGLGLLGQYCDTMTFRKLNITPGKGRTVASNADFFQISGCKGLVTIEDTVCSAGHDDFINTHGTHLKTVDISGRQMTVRFMHEASRGFDAFWPGDQLEIIDHRTLLPYAAAVVETAEKQGDTDYMLTLIAPTAARVGDVVENATWTPELHVRGNVFGPSTGRGVLCTTRKPVRIENNTFYKTGGNVLCIEDDCNFWYESGYTTDVVFSNNKVIQCGYGSLGKGNVPVISINPQVLEKDTPVYVHQNIVITDNDFTLLDTDPCEIEVRHTRRFVFSNNRTSRPLTLKTECVKEVLL